MKAKNVISFLLVVVLIVAFAYVAAFDVKIGNIEIPSTFDKEKGIKQGLDLVGGSIIVFEPDVKDLSKVTDEDMDSAESIIRARLDAEGYAEATISRQGETGIRVEIPNIDDPQKAVEMIGATAKLEFLDADGKVIEKLAKANWEKPVIDKDTCAGCSVCVENCPVDCLSLTGPAYHGDIHTYASLTNPDLCIGCHICGKVCPVDAISY